MRRKTNLDPRWEARKQGPIFWTSLGGRMHLVRELSDAHLTNILKHLRKRDPTLCALIREVLRRGLVAAAFQSDPFTAPDPREFVEYSGNEYSDDTPPAGMDSYGSLP